MCCRHFGFGRKSCFWWCHRCRSLTSLNDIVVVVVMLSLSLALGGDDGVWFLMVDGGDEDKRIKWKRKKKQKKEKILTFQYKNLMVEKNSYRVKNVQLYMVEFVE